MSTIWGFDNFCTFSREHAKNIIDCKKKKMLPVAKEELKPHQDPKVIKMQMLYLWEKNLKKAL